MLSDRLSTLESAGLIQLARPSPDLEYLFRHVLVQDAVYNSLLKNNRRELHLVVGTLLEREREGRSADFTAVLGRQTEAMPAIADAQKDQTSGDRALLTYVSSAACDFAVLLGQGEQALKDSDAQLAVIERFGLRMSSAHAWHQRGRALRLLGRTDEAYGALTNAHSEAKATGWRRDFWAIEGELADLAAERGDEMAADTCRLEAREAVMFIAGHAPTAELKASFLALPQVQRISNA